MNRSFMSPPTMLCHHPFPPLISCNSSCFRSCRKLSKHKSYNVTQVLRKANVYEPRAAAELVTKRDASKPDDWVALARSKLLDTTARLAALRKLYAEQVGQGVGVGGGVLSSSATLASLPSSEASSRTEVLTSRGQGLHNEDFGASSSGSGGDGSSSSGGGSSRRGGGQEAGTSSSGSDGGTAQQSQSGGGKEGGQQQPSKGTGGGGAASGKGKGGSDWPWPV